MTPSRNGDPDLHHGANLPINDRAVSWHCCRELKRRRIDASAAVYRMIVGDSKASVGTRSRFAEGTRSHRAAPECHQFRPAGDVLRERLAFDSPDFALIQRPLGSSARRSRRGRSLTACDARSLGL